MEKVKSRFYFCDFYLIIWSLYQLKGLLYPEGVLNGIIHYIMLFWGVIITTKYYFTFQKIPTFLRVVLVLLAMYIIYGLLYIYSGEELYAAGGRIRIIKTAYLLNSLDSLMPIFIFYYYSCKGFFNDKKIVSYLIVIFIVSIISYLYYRYQMMMARQSTDMTISDESYNLVSLFPLLIFVKKAPTRYILAVVIIVFVILGVKRGAILTSILALLYFIYNDRKNASGNSKVISVVLGVALLVFSFWMFSRQLSSNAYFISRWEDTIEGEASGRDVIYQEIINGIFNNTTIEQIIFGQGANKTVYYAGFHAHNDWLETLCNNGIIGVAILLVFFWQAFKLARVFRKRADKKYYYAAMLLFLVTLVKTFFSMSIQVLHVSQCLLWGYLCYQMKQPENVSLETKDSDKQ